MNGARQERLMELFARACDLPGDEQATFVAQECGDDAELARELAELLAEDAHGHPELESPAVEHVRPGGALDALPESIGPYRILRLLGTGGMGVVYEAEQERPRRRVALKVVRPGLASPELVRRFEHEAQVLGWLDHPGIARIFEAGTADSGAGPQPYFAMELVEGLSLTEYATRERLDVEGRLRLVGRVCAAVHHAHQKGIVHRDLKPNNILVDAAGEPRILDFGVARVTDADLRSTTVETHTGEWIGTLRYMSPEQVAARPSEIDTRSDVYALGVITYELLAGRPPHDFERGQLHEAARAILEDEPSSLGAIDRNLAGDVATIVSKALEKDRARRYASAEELASDIQRYLRHEPIVARPPSALYQLRKFARRNRALVGSLAAVFLVLLVASIVSTALYLEAESARDDAEDRLAALQQLNDFFERLLLSPMPQESGASVRVVDVLNANLDEIEHAFPERPLLRAWLLQAVGNSYGAIAQLERATDLLQHAHDLRVASGAPANERILSKVFLALARLGGNQLDVARRLVDEGFALLPEAQASPLLEARLWNVRMRIHLHGDDLESARSEGARAVQLLEQSRSDPGFLAQFRADYAQALQSVGRLEEAEQQARLAVDEARAVGGERSGMTYLAQDRLAAVLAARGKLAESLDLRRALVEGVRDLVGEESASYVADLSNLATDLRQLRRPDEAEERMREAVRIARRIPADEGWLLHGALVNLGSLCLDNGKPDEAEALLTEALGLEHQERFDPHGVALAHAYMGRILRGRRDVEGARAHYERAYEILVERYGQGSIVECQGLALLALDAHDVEGAVTWFRRAFEAATAGRDVDFNACNVLGPLIANLAVLGRNEEALELSRAHWESCAGAYARETGMPAQFEAQQGWLLHLAGRTEEGLELLAHGTDELIEVLGRTHPVAREYDQRLESVLR